MKTGFQIFGPPEDKGPHTQIYATADEAWLAFCYPALRREAYDCKGSEYKAKRVKNRERV